MLVKDDTFHVLKQSSLTVNIDFSKQKFEIQVSLGELKWHSKISHSQLSKFHTAVSNLQKTKLFPF